MNVACYTVLFLSLLLSYASSSLAQTLLSLEVGLSYPKQHLLAGIYNTIDLRTSQGEVVELEQLIVTLEYADSNGNFLQEAVNVTGRAGHFDLHPSKVGWVVLKVVLGEDTITTKSIPVRAMRATAHLGRYSSNSSQMGAQELKAQRGVAAVLLNYDINARCKTLGFEVIRTSSTVPMQRIRNEGATFEPSARALLEQARAGDLYIFRNITCRCPNDQSPQHLEAILIEVK